MFLNDSSMAPEPSPVRQVLVIATGLGQVKGMTEDIFDVLRHGVQIALGETHPFESLRACFAINRVGLT